MIDYVLNFLAKLKHSLRFLIQWANLELLSARTIAIHIHRNIVHLSIFERYELRATYLITMSWLSIALEWFPWWSLS